MSLMKQAALAAAQGKRRRPQPDVVDVGAIGAELQRARSFYDDIRRMASGGDTTILGSNLSAAAEKVAILEAKYRAAGG